MRKLILLFCFGVALGAFVAFKKSQPTIQG